MEIFTTGKELVDYLDAKRSSGKKVGFVPTMGALHDGHLSLIREAQERAEIVVASIFVNPTQFNDPKDLEKYPRPKERDIEKLEAAGCDILFMPEVSEMYSPDEEEWFIDLHGLDQVLEGSLRSGHYQGVTQIVKKLFDVVQPDFAFFGQKDYQQFLVVNELVKQFAMKTQLVMCPIVREHDGLAMSSRNVHLSQKEHKDALIISKVLFETKASFDIKEIDDLKRSAESKLRAQEGLELQYFEICDGKTLTPIHDKNSSSIVALVAAKVGQTRLIDNIILK